MMRIKNKIHKRLFERSLELGGYFEMRSKYNAFTQLAAKKMADLTFFILGGERKMTVDEVAREWQRMFYSEEIFPLQETKENTVYACVKVVCPLRNTEKVYACHRLMGYDRRLIERINDEFEFRVLESQADPDTDFCEVAICRKDTEKQNLKQAHEKPMKKNRPESDIEQARCL